MATNDIHVINITIEEDNHEQQILDLLTTVRPKWQSSEIKFNTFTEGITNKLIGTRLKSDTSKSDMVLVRIYGHGSDLIIDREVEMANMVLLHAAGCAKQLYAKFNNGIAYGFVQGKCLDTESVRDPTVTRLIAEEMVHMMLIKPENINLPAGLINVEINKQPKLFKKTADFLELVPEEMPDAEQDARYKKLIRPKCELIAEVKELESVLTSLDCEVVFCHNDLLLKNIVYNEAEQSVSFIDYEYGCFNYLPFDLGNHFCEYAGVDTVDYSLYPQKDYQLQWLRQFLETKVAYEGRNQAITDDMVETLYAHTNKFALMSHFFWGLWGIIQAKHSIIDFDYLEYAAIRFGEYFRRKEEFLKL